MAKKIKVNRKKIKKPDEFQTFSDRVIKYLSANKNAAYGVASGIIAVLLIISLGSYSLRTRRARAEYLLAQAFSIMQTPLVDDLTGQEILKGAKSFATTSQRNQEAISKLNEVVQKFSRSEQGLEARYRLGEVYFLDGNFKQSIAAYEDFLKELQSRKTKPEFMEYSAYLGLGKNYFQLEDYEKAIFYFQKIIDSKKSAGYEPEAMLGLARCLAMQKNYEAASGKLNALIESYPGTVYEQLARLELQKIPGQKKSR
jgi:tetratricopeptide (TPR) repeat protein